MLRYFSFVFVLSLLVGCGSSSSQSGETYLSVTKTPINNTPISINQNISLTFSAQINPQTLGEYSAYIVDELNQSVPCTLELSGSNEVLFTPYQYFQPNATYSIVVTTELQDVFQRHLSKNFIYPFTTLDEAIDSSALTLRAIVPSNGNTDALVESNIVLDFSKNLSLAAQNSVAGEYISVVDDNATQISGSVKVFNSLLIFTPDTTLPYGVGINVTLNKTVSDMYGNEYNLSSGSSWSFQTKTEAMAVDRNNSGYKIFDTLNGTRSSYVIKTLSDGNTSSKVAVATQDGVDLYKIDYGTYPTEPRVTHLYRYATASAVKSLESYNDEYLFAALSGGGLLSLKDTGSSLSLIGTLNTTETIYKLKAFPNEKLAAVGPEYGFGVYSIALNGALSVQHYQDANNTTYLDVTEATDPYTLESKLYVADYQGGVDIYDENGSFFKQNRSQQLC